MRIRKKRIVLGALLFIGTGCTLVQALDIPGVTRPYDPAAYYSETAISYQDSTYTPFTMSDLARNGFQVKDVTRGLKNAVSNIKTYTQSVVDAVKLQNKITDMTGLSADATSKMLNQINASLTTTAKINQSSDVGDTDTQTLFRTTQTVGDPTSTFSTTQQAEFLDGVYQNVLGSAKTNVADTEDRAVAIEAIISNSTNAEGRLAAQEANTQAIALQESETARRNALLSNYATLEAAHNLAEHDQELQAAQEVKNAFTFRVADPYNTANTDSSAYTKPKGIGFIDF